MENDTRPCLVGKEQRKARFHCWSHQSWVVEPSPMMGGHPGGQIATTRAIVEYEDGRVDEVAPKTVTFEMGDSYDQ